jgi:hypothetical protein
MMSPWTYEKTYQCWQWLDLIFTYHDDVEAIVKVKDSPSYVKEYISQLEYIQQTGDWN